jgi:hypothetical protein
MIKLGVSAWRLAGQRFGIGRYIEYLLRYWAGHLDSDEVPVFVREPVDLALFGVTPVVIRPPLTNERWENFLLPRQTKNLDVLDPRGRDAAESWRSTASTNSVFRRVLHDSCRRAELSRQGLERARELRWPITAVVLWTY